METFNTPDEELEIELGWEIGRTPKKTLPPLSKDEEIGSEDEESPKTKKGMTLMGNIIRCRFDLFLNLLLAGCRVSHIFPYIKPHFNELFLFLFFRIRLLILIINLW